MTGAPERSGDSARLAAVRLRATPITTNRREVSGSRPAIARDSGDPSDGWMAPQTGSGAPVPQQGGIRHSITAPPTAVPPPRHRTIAMKTTTTTRRRTRRRSGRAAKQWRQRVGCGCPWLSVSRMARTGGFWPVRLFRFERDGALRVGPGLVPLLTLCRYNLK